jgi:hypothetical protein
MRPATRTAWIARTLCCALLSSVVVGCDAGDDPGARSAERGGSGSRAAPQSPGPSTGPASPPTPLYASARPGATLSPQRPQRPSPSLGEWDVGAEVLPRRSDGYGVVRPTPPELRVRRLATTDLLPPPPDDRFRATIRPVTREWARRTSLAWAPSCPVALADLRLLRLTFRGFDGLAHTGRMVVHRRVARDVVGVFRRLYAASYPIEQITTTRKQDLDAPPTGDGNTTGAYACRPARGATTWSAHAYGLAVDVNPFMNPYVSGDLVLPELASSYTDRAWRRPGMIRRGDVVTRAFAEIGWAWGGDFRSVEDPMHFSANGR